MKYDRIIKKYKYDYLRKAHTYVIKVPTDISEAIYPYINNGNTLRIDSIEKYMKK